MPIGDVQSRPVTAFTFDVATLTGIATSVDFSTLVDTHTGTLADGTYTGLATTGAGSGATVDVVVESDAATSITVNAGGTGYAVAGTLTIDATLITGGTGGTLVVDIDAIEGDVATVGTFVGGTGWIVGDVVTADENSSDGAGTGVVITISAASALNLDVPETGGIPSAATVDVGGVGYAVGDTQTYTGSGEAGVPDDRYSDHDQYEQGGNQAEYTDATQGSYKPEIPPNVLGEDQILVNTVLKADQPQWKVQQRDVDSNGNLSTIVVFAEPNIVDSNGNRVGQTLRAEDMVDEARCTANGFVWVTVDSIEQIPSNAGTDPRQYGYCREVIPADVDGTATSQADCPTGYKFVTDNCNTPWTATEVNDGTAEAAEGAYDETTGKGFRYQECCVASGNHFEDSERAADAKCLDATTAATFAFATFVQTTAPNENYATTSTAQDYAETTCVQYGFYWDKANQDCVVYTDPATLTTQATCVAEGHIWIAGNCYDGADFGDGHNRDVSFQQDPTDLPK